MARRHRLSSAFFLLALLLGVAAYLAFLQDPDWENPSRPGVMLGLMALVALIEAALQYILELLETSSSELTHFGLVFLAGLAFLLVAG